MVCVVADQSRGEVIQKMLDEADLTVAWLARRLGQKTQTIHNYVSGKREPSPETWQKMEDAIPPSLLGKPANLVTYPPQRMRYAGEVPAGDWGDPLESEDFVDVDPALWKANRFAARVVGFSCAPALMPQDFTIWESDMNPRTGLIVLAQNKGEHQCTVKELVYDPDARRPRLMPINPDMSEPADGEGWGVIARLVCVIREVDGMKVQRYRPEGLNPNLLGA